MSPEGDQRRFTSEPDASSGILARGQTGLEDPQQTFLPADSLSDVGQATLASPEQSNNLSDTGRSSETRYPPPIAGGSPRWTELPVEKIALMYTKMGLSCAEIAERFGVSGTTIRSRLQEAGIDVQQWKKQNRGPLPPFETRDLELLREELTDWDEELAEWEQELLLEQDRSLELQDPEIELSDIEPLKEEQESPGEPD